MVLYGYVYDKNGNPVIRVGRVKDRIVFEFLQALPEEHRRYFLRVQKRATRYFRNIAKEDERRSDELTLADWSVKDYVGAACMGEVLGYHGRKKIQGNYFWPLLVDDLVFPEVEPEELE